MLKIEISWINVYEVVSGPANTRSPRSNRHPRSTRSPSYTRDPKYTRGPRYHHDLTWLTQPAPTESVLRDSSGKLQLPPPATPSANYLLSRRSSKQRYGSIRTSDTVRSQEAPTVMWYNDKPDCKKPSTRGAGNKYSCHLQQESKWTNSTSQRRWYRNNTYHSRFIN